MTLMSTTFISVESYSDRQERNVQRVLDSLERSESRLIDHYAQMRGHQRTVCQLVRELLLPQRFSNDCRQGVGDEAMSVHH